jgi:hypothetical protein
LRERRLLSHLTISLPDFPPADIVDHRKQPVTVSIQATAITASNFLGDIAAAVSERGIRRRGIIVRTGQINMVAGISLDLPVDTAFGLRIFYNLATLG